MTTFTRRQFAQTVAATAAASLLPTRALSATAAEPPFPLSVMLWTVFRDLPFEERLARIAQTGYRNVELVGEYKDWSPADFAHANAARQRLGLHFDATAGLANGVGNPATRTAFLDELRAALVPMQTLDCPAMIVLSGNIVEGLTRQQQHDACIETLRQAAKLIEGRTIAGEPVRLLLECIDPEENPHHYLQTAAEGIDLVRAVNHPQVQFLYDFFHEQIAAGNLIEKLEHNIDIIGLIHVADVPGRHHPGSGEINYASIYRKLADLHYRHAVAMEFLPLTDAVSELRTAREMVSTSITQ
ncbi:MAG: TIM barrel protein [Terracidiphilus sp.]|nr:TIM barrel protein [Terracidiphilus sp.]